MRDGRRATIWMLATVLTVLAGDRLGDALLNAILVRSQFRFSRLYRGWEKASIVTLGDSRGVNCFYAPRIEQITGQSVLNLSYNGLSSRIGEVVLRDYLERNRAPRLVMLEVTYADAPMDLVSELRTYSNLSPGMRALYTEAHPLAAKAGRVFRLIAYDSEMFLRAVSYLRRSDQDWISRTTISPELLASDRAMRKLRINTANLDAFERSVRLLRERGIQVCLIVSPYQDPSLITNIDEFIRLIEQRARRVDPLLRVHDYARSGGPPENFSDGVHLNARGAEALLQQMQRDALFTPGTSPQAEAVDLIEKPEL
ncbi:MAG: hypothetical protein QOC81_248 [Thermoanaerobaculia bacterium]|jgi:hypothetical protein|nr:hypothetical protein [Thermoanaerobaculia bacterium]